jgi:hypothetical protein
MRVRWLLVRQALVKYGTQRSAVGLTVAHITAMFR